MFIPYENRIADIEKLNEEIKAFRPLSEHVLKQIKEYYRIGLTFSSNAIEGNTLTETETKVIIEDGLTIGGKTLQEHLEVLGHSEAYDAIYSLAKKTEICEDDILFLHKLFYYRIDSANAGKYRQLNVIITGSEHRPPNYKKVPDLMKHFCDKMLELKSKSHPVEYAALLHKGFVDIHPFVDGNGRTARLLMNLVLLQKGYAIAIIPPILRSDYISVLELSRKNEEFFVNFISSVVYQSSRDYLRLLKDIAE